MRTHHNPHATIEVIQTSNSISQKHLDNFSLLSLTLEISREPYTNVPRDAKITKYRERDCKKLKVPISSGPKTLEIYGTVTKGIDTHNI